MDKDKFIEEKIKEWNVYATKLVIVRPDIKLIDMNTLTTDFWRVKLGEIYSHTYSQGLKRAVEVLPEERGLVETKGEDEPNPSDYMTYGFNEAIDLAKKNIEGEIKE